MHIIALNSNLTNMYIILDYKVDKDDNKQNRRIYAINHAKFLNNLQIHLDLKKMLLLLKSYNKVL